LRDRKSREILKKRNCRLGAVKRGKKLKTHVVALEKSIVEHVKRTGTHPPRRKVANVRGLGTDE